MISIQLAVFLLIAIVMLALLRLLPAVRRKYARTSSTIDIARQSLVEDNSQRMPTYFRPVKSRSNSTFNGIRTGHLVTVDNVVLPLRDDLRNHSPTGFDWGFYGAGSVQLALAILAWEFDENTALQNYQRYAEEVISRLPSRRGFCIDSRDLHKWLDNG